MWEARPRKHAPPLFEGTKASDTQLEAGREAIIRSSRSLSKENSSPPLKRPMMTISLDHHLQERMPRDVSAFPAAFYCDELAALPDCTGPMHWHPYFEIATAQSGTLDYQVGQTHMVLKPGDSIFVNQNMLHRIRQLSGTKPDRLPALPPLRRVPTRRRSLGRGPSTD